jgi:hypothetical protein
MIIKNLIQNDDGSVDFDFQVDAKENEFLLDFAIKELIRQGIIKTQIDEQLEMNAQQELEFELKEGKLQ